MTKIKLEKKELRQQKCLLHDLILLDTKLAAKRPLNSKKIKKINSVLKSVKEKFCVVCRRVKKK